MAGDDARMRRTMKEIVAGPAPRSSRPARPYRCAPKSDPKSMNNPISWPGRTSLLLSVVCLLSVSLTARAQWLTQSITLTNGWNAVYVHVDASYDSLEHQIAWDTNSPIQEVWLWAASPSTIIPNIQNPVPDDSLWSAWVRSSSLSSRLQRLIGNAAYLVRVERTVAPFTYTWKIKGKPVPPKYQWTSSGLNFLGFPTIPAGPPNFDAFLSQCPELYPNPTLEIYRYPGGDLGSNNPVRISSSLYRTTPVQRGQAYWMREGDVFNRYFAPFELALADASGIDFGRELGVSSLRLRNLTTGNLTVIVQLIVSESAPSTNQPSIAGVPPLLVRGDMDMSNLTYGCTNLTTTQSYSWTLPAKGRLGCEKEVFFGLDRSAIASAPGSFLAGVLRFKDSLGYVQMDVPVSAIVGSSAGLWVGAASVTKVGEYLKSYQKDFQGNLLLDTNGSYVVTTMNTNLGVVASPFPLRLIVHNPEGSGNAAFLQRVYCGLDLATNPVVSTGESALNPTYLAQARRISATHLPWTPTNTIWWFDGRLGQASNLTTTVTLAYNDQASNPFLHTYHPDHDNLDPTFRNPQPQGAESYALRREIRLGVIPPGDDFASRTSASATFSGNYAETLTLLGLARGGGSNDARTFEVRGLFSLSRIAASTNLVAAP